jgi:phosphoketolase
MDKPVIAAFHAFDMTVLNDPDQFHLVIDTIDRPPETGGKGGSTS